MIGLGGNKRTIAVLLGITVVASVPVFLMERSNESTQDALLQAAAQFETSAFEAGGIEFTSVDLFGAEETGWANADGQFFSELTSYDSVVTYVCESIVNWNNPENCYRKVDYPEINYVSPKWRDAYGPLTLYMPPVEDVTSTIGILDDPYDPNQWVWTRDGDTFTVTYRDGDIPAAVIKVETFTITDDTYSHTIEAFDGDEALSSSSITASLAQEELALDLPTPDEVFTDAEWDAEQDRLYQLRNPEETEQGAAQ